MKTKTIVIIIGAILTCVFAPVGIIVLIVGLCMKNKLTPEEIEQQEREQALDAVETEMLRKNYRFNPVVEEIVKAVVDDFSSGGEYNKLLRYNEVREILLKVRTDGVHYTLSRGFDRPEGVPEYERILMSFRSMGIQDISPKKASVIQEIIFEELKKQCPYLKISGNFIVYKPTIKI